MAKRTLCLCDGKYIGIETIYTVIDGKQINNPEPLKKLRLKSDNRELFCPCGCGANLVLVAGDRNLREQHFRLLDANNEKDCHYKVETPVSINSKIVLKCWLDQNLKTDDLETRVPIDLVGTGDRRFEFSVISRSKNIGIVYWRNRLNILTEKISSIKENTGHINVIYVIDIMNAECNGQYPEHNMKIVKQQGYVLFLKTESALFSEAKLKASFYEKDVDGLWKEIIVSEDFLSEYTIDEYGDVLYKTISVAKLMEEKKKEYVFSLRKEIDRRNKLRAEREVAEQQRIELKRREAELRKKKEHELEEQRRKALEKKEEEIKKKKEEELAHILQIIDQQETVARDSFGNRWIRCKICKTINTDEYFTEYGGLGEINLGTCKACDSLSIKQGLSFNIYEKKKRIKPNKSCCPQCGATLILRNGRYGEFLGCSNYPKCKYTSSKDK